MPCHVSCHIPHHMSFSAGLRGVGRGRGADGCTTGRECPANGKNAFRPATPSHFTVQRFRIPVNRCHKACQVAGLCCHIANGGFATKGAGERSLLRRAHLTHAPANNPMGNSPQRVHLCFVLPIFKVWVLVHTTHGWPNARPEGPGARCLRNCLRRGEVCLVLNFGTVTGGTARQVSPAASGETFSEWCAAPAGKRESGNPNTSSIRTATSPTSRKSRTPGSFQRPHSGRRRRPRTGP